MADQLFELTYNDQPIEPPFEVVEPGDFKGVIKPIDEWPAGTPAVAATLAVFTTPIEAYVDLEEELKQKDGLVVSLGEVQTWTHYGDSVEFHTQDGNVYDVFCVATRQDGTGALQGGIRYAVTENQNFEIPNGLTFEEARFLGYTALGLTRVQAQDVNVQVVPMTAWGDTLPSRLVIAGLKFVDTPEDTFAPGLMVSHLGGVDFYHGATAAETLRAAGLSQ